MRRLAVALGALALWQGIVAATGVAPYLLPGPVRVATALWRRLDILIPATAATLAEIAGGLVLGVVLGTAAAVAMAAFRTARDWLEPAFVASQAVPVIAIAPLLVLWLGYGLAPKIAVAALVVFFPLCVTLFQALRGVPADFIDSARTLGCRDGRLWLRVRLPASLPAFGAGLRAAAAIAPIGAVIGEWVGAGGGLGFVMLQANAKLQIDLVFAALAILIAIAIALHAAADRLADHLNRWNLDLKKG